MPVIWPPPAMPFDRLESVWSICGHDLMSRSRTIAKCCGVFQSRPRWYRRLRDPLEDPVALAREGEADDRLAGLRVEVLLGARRLQVRPVISGTRFSSFGFVGSYLKR